MESVLFRYDNFSTFDLAILDFKQLLSPFDLNFV